MNIQKTRSGTEETTCSEKACSNCFDQNGCVYRLQKKSKERDAPQRPKKNPINRKALYLLILPGLLSAACASDVKGNHPVANTAAIASVTDDLRPEKGYAKGRVTDTQGRPLAGVLVYVDNTVFFNSGISTLTDAKGYYRVQVPQGAWRVYAQTEVNYNGKRFRKMDLHPDNTNSFSAGEGIVCNFQWKLTGEKPAPLTGFYGGLVNLLHDPGSDLYDVENIEFTFTPDGPLIDGSAGTVITAKSGMPRTTSYSKINDIPMGRYTITARHIPTGKTIKLANDLDRDNFSSAITVDFEPELNYCDRCIAIVYSDK